MNDTAENFELTAPVETLPVSVNPMQMLGAALDRGLSVADLGPLMDLVERDQANKARIAFMAAMADFQANCPTIRKVSTADRGKGGKYTFAPFDEIMRTIRPHLKASELSIRFTTELTGESVITATCYLSHRDGHTESSTFAAPVDPNMRANDTQKMGSANSYAKRYCLNNILNLAGSDFDDDGSGASEVEPLLTEAQVVTLRDHTESLGGNEQKFAESLGADCLENVAASRWPQAMTTIERHQKARKGEE